MKWSRKPAIRIAWTVWAVLLLSVVLACGCTLAQPEVDTSEGDQTPTEEAVDEAQASDTQESREEIAESGGATTAASDGVWRKPVPLRRRPVPLRARGHRVRATP